MTERTISIAPLPANCTPEHIKKVLKEFAIVRVVINASQRKAFVQLQDASDVEAMGIKYDDCKIHELGDAEMDLVSPDFQWDRELQSENSVPTVSVDCLLAIRGCSLNGHTEASVRQIFKNFVVKKVILEREAGVVFLEFGQIDELQKLETRFENGKVSALGPQAHIDIENPVDEKTFLQKYELHVNKSPVKEDQEEQDRFKEQAEKTISIKLQGRLQDTQDGSAKKSELIETNPLITKQILEKEQQEKHGKQEQEKGRIKENEGKEQGQRQRLLDQERKRQEDDKIKIAQFQKKRQGEEEGKRLEQQGNRLEDQKRKAQEEKKTIEQRLFLQQQQQKVKVIKREEKEKIIAEQKRNKERQLESRRLQQERERLERLKQQKRVKELQEQKRKRQEAENSRKLQEQKNLKSKQIQKVEEKKPRQDDQLQRLIEAERKSTTQGNPSSFDFLKKEINIPLMHDPLQEDQKRLSRSDENIQQQFKIKPSLPQEAIQKQESGKTNLKFGHFISAVLLLWVLFIVMHS